MNKAVFNWSGGKDSAMALYRVLQKNIFQVPYLLTSVNEQYQRVSMHGVRVDLLERQAQSIGIPLRRIDVPDIPTMETYNDLMRSTLGRLKEEEINHSIFGDIFLEDLKRYRENQLSQIGMTGVFPIWREPTADLVREFIDLGFRAVTVCVNDKYLNRSFTGREINEQFLNDLPAGIDPCGENGEYHSFVYDGPIFTQPIAFERGEVVYKEYKAPAKTRDKDLNGYKGQDEDEDTGFWFCDLLGK